MYFSVSIIDFNQIIGNHQSILFLNANPNASTLILEDIETPGRWLIKEMYLAELEVLLKNYFNHCRQTTLIDIVTCNHTFKCAFKVGYRHPLIKRFIK